MADLLWDLFVLMSALVNFNVGPEYSSLSLERKPPYGGLDNMSN
jgi:hypothetical protein